MDFLKNDAMRTEQKIRTELVRLSAGGRLLRLTEAVSGLTLERALDTRQSVVRQKNELLGMFNVALQAAAPNQLYKNMLGKIGAKGSIREIPVSYTHLERLPIVHAAALEVAVGDAEAERVDQVQARAGERAQAADIARVLRDFGAEQHHVEHKKAGTADYADFRR